MRKTTAKVMVAVMLSSSIVAVAPGVFPATVYAQQVVNTGLSKPISIENIGTIELKTIYTVPSADGQVVSFTLDIVNNGKEMIDFNKYWLRIKTNDGKNYPMRWVDQSKNLIYPGQRQTILFYTVLPKSMTMSDIKLRLVKWDTSSPSFERELGDLPINAAVVPTLGKSLSKFIGLTNNQIEARVELGGTIEDSRQKTVNYYVKLLNKGQFAFTLPEYQYVLVTNTGVAYPLTVNSAANNGDQNKNQLLPWIDDEIELTGIVPSSVDLKNVAVYILHPHGGDKGQVMLPVTVFRAFDAFEEDGPSSDQSIEWGAETELLLRGEKGSDESKTSLVVTSVQRFPWDHRDLLSAQVKLINTGNTAVSIPQLTGQFVLGDGYKVNAEVVLNDADQTLLHPGSSITYQVLSYISYSSSFRNAHIELKEKSEAGYQRVIKSGRIPNISFTERATQIAVVDPNQNHVIGEGSSLSTVKLGEATTYKSANGKRVVSRLVVTNLEQRAMKVPSLKAYYQTKQGIMYPATISSQNEENNFPRGSSVISVYADFPEEINQEELLLIVGEEIKDKGIKDGISYQLTEDVTAVADRIETINYYPYTLKFSNFFADDKGFTFTFKNEKSFNSIANLSERSLVMEITDIFGDVVDKHDVLVEGDKSWNGTVKLPVPNVPSEYGNNVFTVTIYDEYNGARKALAKQTFYIYRSAP